MKKWLNYLPTIFILSIVLSLVFYSSQGSTVQINYTQFEKIVDEVDFKKSSMTISSTVIQLEGTYEQNSKTVGYKVIVPRTEKNIEKLEKDLQRNGGKLTVEDPNQGSVWISILSQIIPFLIIAVFFYFMFSKMGGGGNNKAFEFAKSKARVESNVKVRFKDVAGCEEEKEEVKRTLKELWEDYHDMVLYTLSRSGRFFGRPFEKSEVYRISADGNVFNCPAGLKKLGNLKEKNLRSILQKQTVPVDQ